MPLLHGRKAISNCKLKTTKVMHFRTQLPHTSKELHTLPYPQISPARGVSPFTLPGQAENEGLHDSGGIPCCTVVSVFYNEHIIHHLIFSHLCNESGDTSSTGQAAVYAGLYCGS